MLGLGTAIAGLVLGPAPLAAAHTELLSTTPEDGATLQAVPATATLTFAPVTPTVSGSTVTVPLTAAGAGAYAVVYRVVSADGHPVSGRLGFTVAGAATSSPSGAATATPSPAETTPTPAETAAAAPSTGDDARDAATGSRIAGAVAIVLALGVVVYAGRRRVPLPSDDDREPVHRP
jgi:methionine-rich copper-binding protein CopC